MITIIIKNTKCKIANLTDPLVIKAIDMQLSYDVQGFKFMKVNNNWDGRYRLLTKNHYFPIGMLRAVEKLLSVHGCKYNVIDNREKINYGKSLPAVKNSKFKSREYQVSAISDCIKAGSGIIRMCTGSGKSYVIASLVAHYNISTIIYVVSIDLLHQMVKTLKDSYNIDAGIIGDGKCDIKQINVMTIWSAGAAFNKKLNKSLAEDTRISRKKLRRKQQIINLVRSANLIVLDECQYAGSDTFQFLSKESISARHRFLFSGTPWRDGGDDILLESVAGKKITNIDASFLIRKGFLVRPKIVFKDVPIMRRVGKTYNEVYSNYIVNNDDRNNMAVSVCKNFIKNGLTVLILIKNINHGDIISKCLEQNNIEHLFLNGSSNSIKREDGIEQIQSGKIKVIIASTIFDIGVDIPSLTALISLGGGKSTGRALQRVGRVIRSFPGKETAYVVDFYDQCKYLREHSQVRFKTLASESEFILNRIK